MRLTYYMFIAVQLLFMHLYCFAELLFLACLAPPLCACRSESHGKPTWLLNCHGNRRFEAKMELDLSSSRKRNALIFLCSLLLPPSHSHDLCLCNLAVTFPSTDFTSLLAVLLSQVHLDLL
ncbi:hypothetical protein AMECASPLE_038368 [Ameca splendens]|uniref:Secreted protein n=1 Tax=Ameca splendens TaxID=208324 RepID=A0ABV0ZIQ3_9TELE